MRQRGRKEVYGKKKVEERNNTEGQQQGGIKGMVIKGYRKVDGQRGREEVRGVGEENE